MANRCHCRCLCYGRAGVLSWGWLAMPLCEIDLSAEICNGNDLSIQSYTWRRAIGQLVAEWLATVGS